jgi:hypothetical protein
VSKVIYIPELRKNLIFFEKSGSSLMVGFFKSLLDWKGIKVADGQGEGETIYFVRNPMERLISIYYHTNVVKSMNMGMEDKVEGLNRFLNEYTTKCKTSDNPHYLPQTWVIKVSELSEGRVYKIEDIREGWDKLVDRYKPSSNISFSTARPFFTAEEYIKDFGILEEIGIPMDDNDMMYSITLYNFINSRLDIGHHHNESGRMIGWLISEGRRDILGKLKEITKEEMNTFGYTNKELI